MAGYIYSPCETNLEGEGIVYCDGMMKLFVQVADGAQQVLRAASEIGIIGVNGRRVRVPIAGNSHLDGECIDTVVQGGRVRLATFSGDSKDGSAIER